MSPFWDRFKKPSYLLAKVIRCYIKRRTKVQKLVLEVSSLATSFCVVHRDAKKSWEIVSISCSHASQIHLTKLEHVFCCVILFLLLPSSFFAMASMGMFIWKHCPGHPLLLNYQLKVFFCQDMLLGRLKSGRERGCDSFISDLLTAMKNCCKRVRLVICWHFASYHLSRFHVNCSCQNIIASADNISNP